jgi:hypothetical protein
MFLHPRSDINEHPVPSILQGDIDIMASSEGATIVYADKATREAEIFQ